MTRTTAWKRTKKKRADPMKRLMDMLKKMLAEKVQRKEGKTMADDTSITKMMMVTSRKTLEEMGDEDSVSPEEEEEEENQK